MRLNPIYHKEMMIRARGIKTTVLIVFYNTILAIVGLVYFYIAFENKKMFGLPVSYSTMLQIYSFLAAIEFILVLFIVPGLTAGSIAGEREKQTLDILLSTNLKPIQIINGKLFTSITIMIILALSSLPIIAIVFSIGGISFYNLLEYMILIIVTAFYIGSIGMLISTVLKRTTAATVITYAVLLFLLVGSFLFIRVVVLVKENKLLVEGSTEIITLGNYILALLGNPLYSFLELINKQTGTTSNLLYYFNYYKEGNHYIRRNWFEISMIVQLLLGTVLCTLSANYLNPWRQNFLRKNKKL